jgi:hypothetical protein
MSLLRKGIPIPSFAIKDDEETILKLSISKANLLQVDCALQLYLNQNKKNTISYTNFCKHLVPKLILEASTDPKTSTTVEKIQELSHPDRLWHDLQCILVPNLYETVTENNNEGAIKRKIIFENRYKAARELIDIAITNGVSKRVSNNVLKVLEHQQAVKKENKSKKESKETSKLGGEENKLHSSSSIIQPGMTLEQRVRARASIRDQALQKAHSNKDKDEAVDLVKVADAIFSHARHVLRRTRQLSLQNRFKKTTNSQKQELQNTTCVFLFEELLPALPNMTREEVTTSLEALSIKLPGWIRWKNPSKPTNQKIHKKATVWLETANYKQVRAQMLSSSSNSFIGLKTPQNTPPPVNSSFQVVTLSGNKRSTESFKFTKLQATKRLRR